MYSTLLRPAIVALTGMAFMLSFAVAYAAGPLTTSCIGTPGVGNITWTASTTGGVAPFTYLWGNASTALTQTVSAVPGNYTMTLQTTDASSTPATATCATTVSAAPIITSFIATPTSIASGQSAVLSWAVSNASSTVINNGVGTVVGTSVTVSPTGTTTYTITATNPGGTTTGTVTVTVTPVGPTISEQIKSIMAQIDALQKQLIALLKQQATTTPPTVPGSTCYDFSRNMKRGDRGDDVRRLQLLLASDPSLFSTDLATGVFGPATEKALLKFQRKSGILVIGSTTTAYFGPASRGLFKKLCNSSNNNGNSRKNKSNDDDNDDDD